MINPGYTARSGRWYCNRESVNLTIIAFIEGRKKTPGRKSLL